MSAASQNSFPPSAPTLESYALMSTAELSVALSTALDASDMWCSYGKSIVGGEPKQKDSVSSEATPVGASPVSSSPPHPLASTTFALVSEEATIRSALIEEAGTSAHLLSCTTMSDDETATIRSLPRATLEALVLASCATYRAHRGGPTNIPHPFGSTLGPQFDALVSVKRAKHLQDYQPSLLPPTQRVLRNGAMTVVAVDEIVAGDLLVMSLGDVVPCDALLLSVRSEDHRVSSATLCHDVSINAVRISGSVLPLERRAGCFLPCSRYGAMSVLPQQSILRSSAAPTQSSSALQYSLLAVALRTSVASSWMSRQQHSVRLKEQAADRSRHSQQLSNVELLPLWVVPQPSIHQFQRCAMLKAALCATAVIECEYILVDEAQYAVTSVVWGGRWLAAHQGVGALLHNNPVEVVGEHSSMSASSAEHPTSVNETQATDHTRHSIHSFLSSASNGSRVAAVATGPGLQSLVIAALLATSYPSSASAQVPPEDSGVSDGHHRVDDPASSIRRFLLSDPHARDVLRPQYQPITEPTVIRLKGSKRITARLFGYTRHLVGAARGDVHRHAVLVVYGDARTVMHTSSFMASPKGQVRVDRSAEQVIDGLESSVVCAPEFLFGIATADILWDHVGTKNIPSPSDLAALLAQTTSLCYQGAFVCEVGIRPSVVNGVRSLMDLGIRVVISSCTRSAPRLQHLLLRRCGFSQTRMVVPDPLGRWLDELANEVDGKGGALIAFAGAAEQLTETIPRLVQQCGSAGIVYCGGSCGSVVGFAASDVAVMMVGPSEDRICQTVLRNAASVSVSRFGVDDLADAIAAAREHLKNHSPSNDVPPLAFGWGEGGSHTRDLPPVGSHGNEVTPF